MSSKAMLYTVNSNATAVASNGAIPVGDVIRRVGQDIVLTDDGYALIGNGHYLVSVNVTVIPKGRQPVTAKICINGQQIAGAMATVTPVRSGAVTQITLSQIPTRSLCGAVKILSVQIDRNVIVQSSAITIRRM